MMPKQILIPFVLLGLFVFPCWSQQERPLSGPATDARARWQSWKLHREMKEATPFSALNWQLVGPEMCGGRIESIACPANSPSTIYVGAGSGGLWKTVNNGISWQPLFDDQPTQAIGDVAVSQSNPQIVWVGTGEVLMARSSLAGMGVFKSQDGGNTWKAMGLADTHHIGRVLIHPQNPEIVYVAAIGHRHSGNENRGLFKTEDGGSSWKKCLYHGNNVSAIDIVMEPGDPQTLYVTTWQRDLKGQKHEGGQSAIYRSRDGGENWTRLGGGLPTSQGSSGRIAIDVAPSEPRLVYALLDNAVFEKEKPRDLLFRSEDRGQHWTLVNEGDLKTGWDWCEIRVSPDNPRQIYSIGQKSFRSLDGGRSFEEIGGGIVHLHEHGSRMLHLDTHSMWIDPRNPDRVLFGNDGGLYLSYDRCRNWLHLNNLPIAECYAISHDRMEPYNILIGTQDNAALFGPHTHRPRLGEPDRWKHVYLDPWGGGDSYFTYRDPADRETIYYEHQFGALRRKNLRTGKTVGIRPRSPDDQPLRFAWMTPFFLSQFDEQTVYFAANRVFKSGNRGDDWQVISGDLAAGPDTPNLRYKAITTMAESKLKKGRLFAGTDNGNLFRTDDDGGNWIRIDAGLPRCNFRRVFPSPHAEKTLFVALSGLATDDFSAYLFRSDDLGKSWKSISNGLPNARMNVIREHPRQKDLLFAGSDLGVYVSVNGGSDWHSLSPGLPAASVHDLFVHPDTNELVIGTHGRSVFLADLDAVSVVLDQLEKEENR
ncbi:MAG: hypothetical protein VX768_13900 [Planctomycetota bacterium]|nr:hypothetical protein [Planctomycetota bacterium]